MIAAAVPHVASRPAAHRGRRKWRPPVVTVALAIAGILLGASPVSAAAEPGDCWDTAPRCHTVTEIRGTALDQTGWLQQDAKAWARHMADQGAIFHAQPPGWGPYGENVGVGPDTKTVMAAFVGSPAHLANIRDPDFTQVGIGSAWADGRIYIVIRFH